MNNNFRILLPSLLIGLLFVSCSVSPTSKFFEEANGPSIKELGLKRITPSEVIIKRIDPLLISDKAKFSQWQKDNRTTKGLVFLGHSNYQREGQAAIDEIRSTASRMGAKVAYVHMPYAGKGKKTVTVPIAHAPGRTITHSSDTYGSVSGNGYVSGSYGDTPFYGNSSLSGSYSETSRGSTYIPGSTTYAARDVSYDAYEVLAMFYAPSENLSEAGRAKLQTFRDNSIRY